jgi:glycosyltransferase involved in cell wall biosynthesis
MTPPDLSLIVPTRDRADSLARFLASLTATTTDLARVEIVLVVDNDAVPGLDADPRLRLTLSSGPPGRTMGALDADGYAASHGDFVMLLNDDVVVRTPQWDDKVLAAARYFADGVVLVHVNDTLMRHHLCTFPLLSRRVCELMGGVCPREYVRYCIDDHIEDVFNLLAFLGERRTIYLPDVVFEHTNAVEMGGGVREYHADPRGLALDEPRFRALFEERKRVALGLIDLIAGEGISKPDAQARDSATLACASGLENLIDPLALRTPGRQIVWSSIPPPSRLSQLAARLRRCWRERGVRGLLLAATHRLFGQR